MKVYLGKFEKNGKVAYKTGHTKWFKSEKRFADDQYKIFDKITILDDIYISHEDARIARKMSEGVEACLHAFFPKNFYLEPYFMTEDHAFEGLSGITEMFILPEGWTEAQMLEIFRRVKRNVGFVLK